MGNIYSRYKIFHYQEKLDSLPQEIGIIKPPVHIRIKPTNVCNHHCWYCAYKSPDLQLGQDMVERDFIPKEKMLEIIDDCAEMGVKAVTFSGGGEPFVYRYMRDTKVGEFSKIMKNIEEFKKLGGKCLLGISLIVDKDNWSHIYEFTKMLKWLGVDTVKISPCIVSNDGHENDAYHAPFFADAKELAVRTKKELEDESFEVNECYHGAEVDFAKDYGWCPMLQMLPVIGADLNMYPCQDKAYNLEEGLLGSIKEMRFKDWWFGDKNNFFKIDPSKVCNHHCVANGKNKMILEYLDADKEHLGFV
jgi:MoaA/NifB/PqqE/SkfB family radical SAM enzyme